MNAKWNRFLALLLSIILLVCTLPSMTMAEISNDDELTQAFASGLAPDSWRDQLDTPMALNDFCALMMQIIEPFDTSLLPEWEKLAGTALGSTREMKREDAMMAVYEAACLMGEGRDTTGDWVATDALLGKGDHSWELSNEYPEWHNLDDAAPFCTDCDQMIGGAYHFAQGQVSPVSGKRVFDLDEDNKDLHMLEPLTKGEAILILLRFSESLQKSNVLAALLKNTTYVDLQETEKTEILYEEAAHRKDTIINSPTTIVKGDTFIPGETYSGTAYYISPNGNDENDGLSPKTAWKSPSRCTWNPLSPGDAVFYERGGIYRFTEMSLRLQSGVTYSAYGEGAKPVFTIARENSARPECWELQSENNGVKIWKYYQDVPDVAGIVLDDESYAQRMWEWPTPDGWLAVDLLEMDPLNGITAKEDPCTNVQVASAGEYRTIEEGLTEDLTYISRVDITNISYPFEVEQAAPGKLYLRCDKGNPGECFSDIEIIHKNENDCCVVDAWHADGFVLDNISIKYYMDNAVNGNLLRKDALIQNCTVEWGGNRLFSIQSAEPTNSYCFIGDGIYGVAANATVRNNYMRHSGNGCTFESSIEMLENMGTYLVEGNVMENCGQGIRAYLVNEEDTNRFEALILRDNFIIETGNGMNNACTEEPAAIDFGTEKCNFAKKTEVYDNVLIGSTLAIFRAPDPEYMSYDIHDNVIAQNRDGVLLTMGYGTSTGIRWYTMDADALASSGDFEKLGMQQNKKGDASSPKLADEVDTPSSLPVSASDEEIGLGISYGILDEIAAESLHDSMTLTEFCSILRRIVLRLDDTALNEWDTLAAIAAASTRSMKREDAMLAVFEAACVLNKAVCNDDNWYAIDQQLENGQHFWELTFDYPDWANAQDNCPFCDWGDSYVGGAYHFAEGQYSPISGNRVFDFDEEALDLHMLDMLSRGDAIAIAVRFYESIAGGSLYVQPSAEQLEIDAMIDARREKILNTPSDYNATGRTYYVSNNGSDSNDGLSPETAWATLDKINSAAWTWDGQLNSNDFPEYLWVSTHRKEQADIKRGDVVLLERGGIWRGCLRTVAGVTYSAYGEGEKPRIYGSPENGADESKWQLVDGTENIWLFYKPMQQTGLILCDEDTLCLRDYAYWNGQRLIKMSCNANLPWDEVEKLPTMSIETLTEDLHFFCDIPFVTDADYAMTGSLYLRCDAGNPGKVFSSMEFATGNNAWSEGFANVEDDTILDNLCFRFGTTGITAHDSKNAIIRNCEIAWVGGMSMETGNITDSPDNCSLTCTGDAIMLGGVNNIAQHNYITNTFDYGITVEAFYNDADGTSTYRSGCIVSDNLLDYCNGGLLLVDWYAINHGLDRAIFTDITFDNNLVAHTAENLWAHASSRENATGQYEPQLMGALALWLNPGLHNIRVTNNTFAYSHMQEPLIHLARFKEDTSALSMDGNTYMQMNGGVFLFMNEYDAGDDAACWQSSADFDTQRYITEQLKDANGRIVRNIIE